MTPEEAAARDRVDAIARSWISTPYHDRGGIKGPRGGVDCAILLQRIYVEAGLIEDFEIAPYVAQHFLHSAREDYLGTVLRVAHEIASDQVEHGDIALWKIGKCFAHGAIVIKPGWPNIVHAHAVSRCVRRGLGTSVHLGPPILDLKFFSLW